MENKQLKINNTFIICVEGKDEVNFFEAFLKHFGMVDIQVIDFNGKDKFKENVKNLTLLPDFSQAQKILLIRDADYSQEGRSNPSEDAFKSMQDALRNAKLTVPLQQQAFTPIEDGKPQTAIYIMPFKGAEGMLEDLCLQTINLDEMTCIETFLDCMPEKPKANQLSKAKVQAFLAAKVEPINNLGISALRKYWKYDHEKFSELKALLQ